MTPLPYTPLPEKPSKYLFTGARALAQMNLPDPCEGCFWIRSRCREMPYSLPLPGLLFAADALAKQSVHAELDAERRLPPWMPALEGICGYVPDLSYKWFRYYDRKLGIVVAGQPDDLLVTERRTLHIVDYKAARLSAAQRGVMPLYEAQLGVYAYIARRLRRLPGPPEALSLLYMEPEVALCNGLLGERTLALPLRARAVPVSMDAEEKIPELLAWAAEILRSEKCPYHNRDCHELGRMDELMRAQTGDPWVASFGRYSWGLCLLCEEAHTLVPDRPFCVACAEEWY